MRDRDGLRQGPRRTVARVAIFFVFGICCFGAAARARADTCDYYVDSVSGSDANGGTSSSAPLQHLAAVPAVPDGSTICLRRGSTFTDTLWIGTNANTRNDITVEDYGPSNLPPPMIDNSDVIPPSAWSAVGGSYPNLYQATVPGPGTSISSPYGTSSIPDIYINVWECKNAPCTPTGEGGDDDFLLSTSTEAGANSQPGSYYIAGQNPATGNGPADSGSLTIYLSATDGSDPATNGYTYTYSHRFAGLEIDGNNAVVTNIASKKGALNDGSIVQYGDNGSATFNDIEADQGGKHNMLCAGGCTVNNSKFVDEYYTNGNMFVAFNGSGPGLPVTLNNDTFIDGVPLSSAVTAFYGHNGDGTFFPSFTLNGGLIEKIAGGAANFAGGSVTTNDLIINGLTCYDVYGCASTQGSTTLTVADSQQYSATGTLHYAFNAAGSYADLSIASTSMCGAYDQQAAVTNYAGTQTHVGITVASSTIYIIGGSFANTGIYQGGANSTVSLSGTVIDSNQANVKWVNLATSSASYSGDYNSFVLPDVTKGVVGTTTYTGLAAWQTATGQDAHSTTTGSGAGACTLPSFSITGPSSGYVNATSGAFTVTPNKAYTGTVTFSPIGAGGAGMNPVVLSFNNSSASQAFSIDPAYAGAISLVPLVAGATTSPTFLAPAAPTYTVNSTGVAASITGPADGAAVSGTVSITATATSTVGISSVWFYLDGAPFGAAVTSGPYMVTWDTTQAGNGTHALSAVATDPLGNTATSSVVSVTVDNAAASAPAQPSASFTVGVSSGGPLITATITASTTVPTMPSTTPVTATATSTLAAQLSALEDELAALLAQANQNNFIFTRDLSVGSTGNDVRQLQLLLISRADGPAAGALAGYGATGFFGPLTRAALVEFQKSAGIEPDSGYFGPITRSYVNR